MVKGEEDGTKESHRLFVRVGLEFRMNIDDKGRADCGEQARLGTQVRKLTRADGERRTKIRVVLRSSSYFLT